MQKSPTPKQLKALATLSQQPWWADISNRLEAELAEAHNALRMSPDIGTLRRMQGRAQLITEFLSEVRDARATLERLGDKGL